MGCAEVEPGLEAVHTGPVRAVLHVRLQPDLLLAAGQPVDLGDHERSAGTEACDDDGSADSASTGDHAAASGDDRTVAGDNGAAAVASGRRARGLVALCGLGCLALVVVSAAVAWPDSSTLVPENAGHPVGDPAWARVFLVCAASALACYGVAVWLLRRGASLRIGVLAVLAVAIQVAPLGAPLLLSTDAWTYWDYGRLAVVHGANPYRDAPRDFADDPAFPYVGEAWRDDTSVYGPGFTLASEPLALAAGDSADAAAWLYKGLAAAALLGAAWLAASLSPRPGFALAFVGWNPLLALHFAGGGHNDAWMAALVVGALWLARAGRRNWAGAAWAAAVLVKWIPLVFLFLRALEARGRRRVGHVGFAVAAAVVVGLATWRYGIGWLGAFGPLARNANDETSYALPHRVGELGAPRWLALGIAAAAFVGAYGWLARRALGGRARLGLAAVLVLLVTPYLAPWYAVWAVPLAAAEDDREAQWLSLGLCAYLLPQTVPV